MAGTASNLIPLNDETTGGKEDVETSKKDIKKNENEDGEDGNPGSGVEEGSDATDNDDQTKKEGKSKRKNKEGKEGSGSEKGAVSGDLLSEEEPTSEVGSETKKEDKSERKDKEGKEGSASEKGATSGDLLSEEEPTSEVGSETKKEGKSERKDEGKEGSASEKGAVSGDLLSEEEPTSEVGSETKKEGKSERKDKEGKEGSASEKGAVSGDLLSEEEPTSEVGSETKKEGKSERKDKEVKEGSASEKGATSGDLLSEEEPTSEGGSETVAEAGSGLTYPLLILGVLAILFAVVVALQPTATDAGHNYRSVEEFEAKINEMKSDFPQQYTVYFNMLANGGRKHLKKIYNEEKEDLTPQAYLIAGYAGARPTLECFVSRLADAFTDGYESLDSKDFAGSDEKIKAELYKSIESKLRGSNKLLVVHNIDKLHFKVAQLFMSFADSHNTVANYQQSLILFTTELPLAVEFSGGRVADEGEAGNHFRNVVWGDAHPDQLAPLWSRVGDGLLLIRGEEGFLKC